MINRESLVNKLVQKEMDGVLGMSYSELEEYVAGLVYDIIIIKTDEELKELEDIMIQDELEEV
jgi:hypothetical protein